MRVRLGAFMSTLFNSSPSSTTFVRPKALSPKPRMAIEVRTGLPFIEWTSTPAFRCSSSARSRAPLAAISSAPKTCTAAGTDSADDSMREA